MERARRLQIQQLGPELTCQLCHGYFVDAFTVVECLHSFCKSCIMEHVKKSCDCPTCGTQLNKARLTSALRPDQTLQAVVYKLVPRLFNDEMQRRRDFYRDHPSRDRSLSPERRGDVSSQQFVYTLTDPIGFSLELCRSGAEDGEKAARSAVRYFQAPAGLGISHLKKLLYLKHGLRSHGAQIDILYAGDILSDELIIMDVAYMYHWDRTAPMRFSYRYTTKRPLCGEAPEPAGSPSKRRCPEPETERLSGADSDKENVENDARPTVAAAAAADALPTTGAVSKPTELPARRPAVGSVPEGPRQPVTSLVTSPRAEPGAAAAGPARRPTEPRPAACAGDESDGAAAAGGHRQPAASVCAEAGAGVNGKRTAARSVEHSVSASGGYLSNNETTTGVASEKNSDVPAKPWDVSVPPAPTKSGGAAAPDKTTTSKRPTVTSNVEERPQNTNTRDAVMVASGEMKHVHRQAAKRSAEPTPSAPQTSGRSQTDVSKSSATPNGVRVCPKPGHTAPSPQISAQAALKSPRSSSSDGLTGKVSNSGAMSRISAASKHAASQKVAPASNESTKGSVAQSRSTPKLSTPREVPNKTEPPQTGGGADHGPAGRILPTVTSTASRPASAATNGVSRSSADAASPSQTSGPAQAPAVGVSASTVTPSTARPDRTLSGGGGGGTEPAPAPATDDRQCEDSGVDTDSSERPTTDNARSPIDVYDFDAEAEDETAVRLKTTPVLTPQATPAAGMGVPRPPAASVAETRQASPSVCTPHPTQRLPNPGTSPASVHRPRQPLPASSPGQRPLPPSTPGQRPPPPSTPGQRPLPPSTLGQRPPLHSTPGQRPPPPSTPGQRPIPPSTPGQRPIPPNTLGPRPIPPNTPGQRLPPPSTPGQRPAMVPSPVPPSPRRSLASLPDLRPIGAGAIPLMTGQLDRFLRLVSRSAVSQPNGSWRLPADASSLLTRAVAPTQPAPGRPIQPKPSVQGRPPGQATPAPSVKSGVQTKTGPPKPAVQQKPAAAKHLAPKALNQKFRLSGTQGIQNLVTNEITITKIPNTSRSGSGASGGDGPAPPPLPAESARSPGSDSTGPAGRVTADGSVTIEKIRAAPPASQSGRPSNSPKLLAIAESLAMKKIQSQRQAAAASGPPPSPATGGLISLSQTQQFHKQQQQQQRPAPRGRPSTSGGAHRQIPNPALLHQQSQGRLTVLNVPSVETAGSGSGTANAGTTSGSLARMERLTNSLGR